MYEKYYNHEDIGMRLGRFWVEPLTLLLVFIPIGLLLKLMLPCQYGSSVSLRRTVSPTGWKVYNS
jgi:hypothetical protein